MKGIPIDKTFNTSWNDYPSSDVDMSIVIYFKGCSFACEGCHNKQLWAFENADWTFEDLCKKIDITLEHIRSNKLVIVGGEPFGSDNNILYLQKILDYANEKNYDVCVYTGYELDKIRDKVTGYKFIKCGLYEHNNLKDNQGHHTNEFVLASKNQKVYNHKHELLTKDGVLTFKKKSEPKALKLDKEKYIGKAIHK